jgi:hypothetical protein
MPMKNDTHREGRGVGDATNVAVADDVLEPVAVDVADDVEELEAVAEAVEELELVAVAVAVAVAELVAVDVADDVESLEPVADDVDVLVAVAEDDDDGDAVAVLDAVAVADDIEVVVAVAEAVDVAEDVAVADADADDVVELEAVAEEVEVPEPEAAADADAVAVLEAEAVQVVVIVEDAVAVGVGVFDGATAENSCHTSVEDRTRSYTRKSSITPRHTHVDGQLDGFVQSIPKIRNPALVTGDPVPEEMTLPSMYTVVAPLNAWETARWCHASSRTDAAEAKFDPGRVTVTVFSCAVGGGLT